ncbi:MAG: hypothetical protein AAF378_14975 [Cyanobacteria bacterium P01_A01_bin.84]
MSNNNEQHPADKENRDLTMVERWALQDKLENEIAAEEAAKAAEKTNNDSGNTKSK